MPSTRPRTDAQRDSVLDAATEIAKKEGLSAVLVAALAAFEKSRAPYTEARAHKKTVTASVSAAKKVVRASRRVLVKELRNWSTTVRDDDGKAAPSAVALLLDGVLPGDLIRMTAREQLTRTADLVAQVAEDREVAGAPEALAKLMAAREALEPDVVAQETAEAELKAARKALTKIQPQFDRAWGVVAREATKAEDAEIASLVPRFRSRPKAGKKGKKDEGESDSAGEPKVEPTAGQPKGDAQGDEPKADEAKPDEPKA